MRQIFIVTAAVWVAVIVALFGATAMIAHGPQRAEAAVEADAGRFAVSFPTLAASVLAGTPGVAVPAV